MHFSYSDIVIAVFERVFCTVIAASSVSNDIGIAVVERILCTKSVVTVIS